MSFHTPEGPTETELRKNRFVDDAGNLRLTGLYGLEEAIIEVTTEAVAIKRDHGEMLRTLTQRVELLDRQTRELGKDSGKRIKRQRSVKAEEAQEKLAASS